jgi:crotonobetainyl-CoA:carnitine CoA-transferase CaiB-like acyl-CoA transferase
LGVREGRDAVADAVLTWQSTELEAAIVDAGGAAAAMHSLAEWGEHPQGRAVTGDPVLLVDETEVSALPTDRFGRPDRPLAGVKVVDLTRVLAGPVATRLLAGWGAEVLRIDPPDWDEPALAPEVTLGKRCARLDLRSDRGKEQFAHLLSGADIIVSGYRPGALDRLGLGSEQRQRIRPGVIDVSVDAYGWSGPWASRRGFDSLVQMSTGIAHAGMVASGSGVPTPLPVQALDHATGYLLAAAAISGLTHRLHTGRGSTWRTSLASMAGVLIDAGADGDGLGNGGVDTTHFEPMGPTEKTVWGDARRLPPPVEVEGAPLWWSLAARPLGTDMPEWP